MPFGHYYVGKEGIKRIEAEEQGTVPIELKVVMSVLINFAQTRMVTPPFKKTPDRARSGELFIASPLSGDQFLSAKTVNPSSSL